jgi:hypothetical protein
MLNSIPRYRASEALRSLRHRRGSVCNRSLARGCAENTGCESGEGLAASTRRRASVTKSGDVCAPWDAGARPRSAFVFIIASVHSDARAEICAGDCIS